MLQKILIFTLLFVSVLPSNDFYEFSRDRDDSSEVSERSGNWGRRCNHHSHCGGSNYVCRWGFCNCYTGYEKNEDNECVMCPGVGEPCSGTCCSETTDDRVECWDDVCRQCVDSIGYNVCRETYQNQMFISATQIAMAISLVLAIFATFVLLYKLCRKTDVRRLNEHRSRLAQALTGRGSNASNGTVQRYVNDRLRDAPPRYSRNHAIAAPSAPPLPILTPAFDNPPSYDQLDGRENPAFMADNGRVPPPYSHLIDKLQLENESKEKDQDERPRDVNERINHM